MVNKDGRILRLYSLKKIYSLKKSYLFYHSETEHPLAYLLLWSLFLFLWIIIKKSLSNTVFSLIKRNHVSIWNWIQKYKPQKYSIKAKEDRGIYH